MLAWLAEDYQATSVDLDQEEASLRQTYDKFRADLAAGKMPPPTLLVGATSDYDPADKSQLLASGGTFELLDVATLRQLTVVEQSLRQGVFLMRHDQQLSDALILPHLREQPSAFYDPATKKLWPGYSWYPEFFERELSLVKKLKPEIAKLQQLIKAEAR